MDCLVIFSLNGGILLIGTCRTQRDRSRLKATICFLIFQLFIYSLTKAFVSKYTLYLVFLNYSAVTLLIKKVYILFICSQKCSLRVPRYVPWILDGRFLLTHFFTWSNFFGLYLNTMRLLGSVSSAFNRRETLKFRSIKSLLQLTRWVPTELGAAQSFLTQIPP